MKLLMDDTGGYCQLLSSVLWLAVYDACAAPVKRVPKGKWYRPTEHALNAIRFFFEAEQNAYFPKYIECLGMEADAFRRKLVRTMYSREALHHLPYGGLPDGAQKNFRFNHTFWLTEHQKGEIYAELEQDPHALKPGDPEHLDAFFGSDLGDPRSVDETYDLSLYAGLR